MCVLCRGDQCPSDLPVSLAVQLLEHDTFIFALCQDHKLRLWSYKVCIIGLGAWALYKPLFGEKQRFCNNCVFVVGRSLLMRMC